MKSFREWQSEQQPVAQNLNPQSTQEGWKSSKDEIIAHWNSLPPSMPLGQVRSVPVNHTGPTMSFDGLRITGSPAWIDFVLARIKDVLAYERGDEGGQTRLQVIYKQEIDNKNQMPIPDSYVFYLQVKQRSMKDQPGGKNGIGPTPKLPKKNTGLGPG